MNINNFNKISQGSLENIQQILKEKQLQKSSSQSSTFLVRKYNLI
jgi:hypothetical protein